MAVSSTWIVRHGDTSQSDVWAILDENANAISLSGWDVLAQARPTVDSDEVMFEWNLDHGVSLGTATVRLRSGRQVTTDSIRLHLDPVDFDYLPRDWSGVFDVEVTLSDSQGVPLRRHTVISQGSFVVQPDVAR